jgi:hypothetical protein
MTSHSRDRYIPSPRPYQPSKSPKALGSDLFSSGAAAEEDLVMDDDEDIGELLERASREKLQPTNKIPILAPESMDTTTGPAKIDHDAVSPEPLTVTPIKPFTRIAPSETKALKASKGKLHVSLPMFSGSIKRWLHECSPNIVIFLSFSDLVFRYYSRFFPNSVRIRTRPAKEVSN